MLSSLVLGTSACGADSVSMTEELGSLTQPLVPPDGWRLWQALPSASGTTETFTDNPGVCLSKQGWITLGRHPTTNRFRSNVFWRLFSNNPVWQDVGTVTFNSKPACTALDEVSASPPPPNHQIAVLGKRSTDNKYYARTMLVDTVLEGPDPQIDPPEQPTLKVNWHKISDDVYASAPGTTVGYGKLLVVGRRSDNVLYLHQNTLSTSTQNPYNSGTWQAAVSVPSLPSPWVAAGDPVIANTVPMIGVVTIMTRARSGTSNRLYYIWWDGTSFFGAGGGSWMQLPTGATVVSSDPALEVDVDLGLATVYIRGATNNGGTLSNQNRIFNSSGLAPNLWENFTIVREQDPDTFANPSAPAAVGNGRDFEGEHVVIAKKSNNQFYFSTPVPF